METASEKRVGHLIFEALRVVLILNEDAKSTVKCPC